VHGQLFVVLLIIMPSPGGQVLWSDLYAIGKALDDLADTLSIPSFDYSKLADNNDTPFPLPSTVAATFGYRFFLDGSPADMSITDEYIVPTLGIDGTPYQMPNDTLVELAVDGYLYFMNTAEGCWCNTMFQVNQAGGTSPGSEKWTLTPVSTPMGCCQTLPVADIGDLLDAAQFFIPAANIIAYKSLLHSGPNPDWLRGPRCTGDGNNVDYKMVKNGTTPSLYNVKAATRQMAGYFTWPVKEDWLNWIVGNINSILDSCCGAVANKIKDPATGNFVMENCMPTFDMVRYTLGLNYPEFPSQPGCVTDPAGWFNGCGAGSGSCPGALVYAATLTQLSQLITDLATQIKPYSATCVPCPDTCPPGPLTLITSGVEPCCQDEGPDEEGSGTMTFSGIESITLYWNGVNGYESSNVGTWTQSFYGEPGCSGDAIFTQSGTCSAFVGCDPGNVSTPPSYSATISALGFTIFASNAAYPMGAVMPNFYQCSSTSGFAGGGTATLSV
jgi:hypothetical protein